MTIKALLIDLSGTLHVGKQATPGAVEAFTRLQESKIPFRLASNTTKESKADLLQRLNTIGFRNVRSEDLMTSLSAASSLVTEHGLNPLLFLSDSAAADFPQPTTDAYDSVVVGLAPEKLSYAYLNQAFRILQQRTEPKRPLIATHKKVELSVQATYFRSDDGELSLGPGPFIQALEQAAEVEAEVVGKPTRSFYELCLKSLERDGMSKGDWSSVAVVGDDIKNDLGGAAIDLGLQRILMKTGKYQPGDEHRGPEGTELSAVEENFAALIDRLLKEQ